MRALARHGAVAAARLVQFCVRCLGKVIVYKLRGELFLLHIILIFGLVLCRPLKAVSYTVVVHNFNLQEKTTSTVDEDNKSV